MAVPPERRGSAAASKRPSGVCPDRVDPAEEHVGGLVAQHALVVVEIRCAGTGLVGEEISLRVEARRENSVLQRHPEIQNIYDRL